MVQSSQSDLDYPRRVVIDDTDPRIQYRQGSWEVDNNSFDAITIFGAPYNGTQHGTTSTTASFDFGFEGEFVQVRGAKDSRKIPRPEGVISDNTTLLAKWTCQVDGSPIKTTPYRQSIFDVTHSILCEQGGLSRGPHVLTVNVTIDDPNTQMFWLDKVEYAPLPNANLAKEVVKIDSSHPSIQLDNRTGAWRTTDILFNDTGTTGAGASFKFDGASVALYGFNEGLNRHLQATTGRYHIDDGGDTSFDISGSKTMPGLPNNLTDYYNQLAFSASNLDPGSHEMVLTFTGTTAGSDPIQRLTIDYFYVTGSDWGEEGMPPSSSHISVATVGGGVAVAIFGLVLISFIAFFLLKKWRSKRQSPIIPPTTPFPVDFESARLDADQKSAKPSVHIEIPMLNLSPVSPTLTSPSYTRHHGSKKVSPQYGRSASHLVADSPTVAGPSASPSSPDWHDIKRASADGPPSMDSRAMRRTRPKIDEEPPSYTEA